MTRVEEIALELVEELCKACSDLHDGGEVLRAFRARARNMVTQLYFNGTALVVSICAARSSARAIEKGLKAAAVNEIAQFCNWEVANKLGLEGGEKIAYAIYGAVILYVLRTLGIIASHSFSDAIKELMDNRLADIVAWQFATWLKRFAEAYIYES